MINDLVAALRDLLEPDPTDVTKDETVAPPLKFEPWTLYLYPIRNTDSPFESGPSSRQDFTLLAILVVEGHEEAKSERDADVSALLDEKRAAYMRAAWTNRRTPSWHHIQAAESRNPPRTLQARGLAIEFAGYRLVD